jgi:glycosyltransferase involved in cell wall biosynthesis
MNENNGSAVPLVSIVTPSYNQGRFIERTIQSVKNQDYPNVEHIIVDGDSTDETTELLRKHEGTYRMQWSSEPDGGQSEAVNKGLARATGQLIGWLNSDDVYVPRDAISAVVQAFVAHPEVSVVYGNVLEIDDQDRVQRLRRNIPKAYQRLLSAFNFISQPAVFWRRTVLTGAGLNQDLDYVMDYELWLRLRAQYDFHHIDRFIAGVRYHGAAKNLRRPGDLKREAAEVQQHYSRARASQLLFSTIVKIMQRAYRVAAIARIGTLQNEPWAVDLKLLSRPAMIMHQLPPFGWLRKKVGG